MALAETHSDDPGRLRPTLVLLHGWGVHSNVWSGFAELMSADFSLCPIDLPGYRGNESAHPADIAELCAALLPRLPNRAIYVGWSLGGLTATYLAAHYPERVTALITVASSPCFIQRDTWRGGMPSEQLERFERRLVLNQESGLRYFARLQAHGDAQEKKVLNQLEISLAKNVDEQTLISGLKILRHTDLRAEMAELQQPHLQILGNEDSLIPAQALDTTRGPDSVWKVSDSGHVPFLSRPNAVAARISDFCFGHLFQDSELRDKQLVARSFGNAVDYDGAADLQREAGQELMRHVKPVDRGTAVDLGCGSAHFTQRLKTVSGAEQVLGVDLAIGMLERARTRGNDATWLCADAEQMPLADDSVDLIFSNFSIQWCQQLDQLASEIYRCLAPGGYAYLCTLGANTLWELRAAWRMIDDSPRVNRFEPIASLRQRMQTAGLVVEACEGKNWVRRTSSPIQLARELRQIGASNRNPNRPSGMTGKSLWRRLEAAYQTLSDSQTTLPVTWEVINLIVRKED